MGGNRQILTRHQVLKLLYVCTLFSCSSAKIPTMKKVMYIVFGMVMLSACTSTHTKLETAIQNYYRTTSLQSGAGNNSITEIEILRFENDTAVAVVTGYYKNSSLPQTESGSIKDTLGFFMEKTNRGFRVKGISEIH